VSVTLRPLHVDDCDLLFELYAANRAFLTPFDPARSERFYTREWQQGSLEQLERDRAADAAYRFLIEAGGEPVGVISASRITRGPFQNAGLGYWVAKRLNGRGVATQAVRLVCKWGFGEAGFHRLEAATLTENTASQTVLRRNGFSEIGLCRNYLEIAGQWRDHLLFQRTVEDA
jgi:[ribosomal protein S5]-alanine N-acetyltransferase